MLRPGNPDSTGESRGLTGQPQGSTRKAALLDESSSAARRVAPPESPYLPLAILFAAVLVFFARNLFSHAYLIPWDFRGFHLPLATAVFDAMKGTGSVLWDTSTYCGRPLFADPQAQIFYPPTALAVFLSTLFDASALVYILEWQLALHVFAAGAFTYLLLRRMGVSTAAALCGGLVYELGGFFASQTQHLGAIDGAAWIPLMWAAAWEFRQKPSRAWFVVLAVAGAMDILVGFPAIAAAAFCSTTIYALILVSFRQMRWRQYAFFLGALLSSVGLSAIMLVPAAQLALLSVARYRTDWFDGGGFPLKYITTFILPPSRQTVCDLLYCGVGGLLLCLIGIFHPQSRRAALPLVCLTALSGIWMLGTVTPFGRLLWIIVPDLIKGSCYPRYAMAAFCLGVATLAGIGLNQMERLSQRLKYAVALFVGAELIIVGSGRPMNAVDVRKDPGITRQQIDGSVERLSRLRQLTRGQPPSRIDTHKGSMAYSSTAPLTLIPTANGYNPLVLERLIQVRLSFAKGYRWGAWYEVENLASPMVAALNIRFIQSNQPIPTVANVQPRYAPTDLPGVYENLAVLPRFWIVHQVHWAETAQEAFDQIHRPDFTPATLAVVERQRSLKGEDGVPEFAGDQPLQSQPDAGATVLRYQPRDVMLSVKTATPGLLVSSEVNYPGWRAFLDGSQVSILETNGAFRGVLVPAGDHIISFRFAPVILYIGAAISASSMCILLLLSCWKRRT